MNGHPGWRYASLAALSALATVAFLVVGSCAGDTPAGGAGEDDEGEEGPLGVAAQAVSWKPVPALLSPGPARFGAALDMSADGSRLIVGNGNEGDVYVYAWNGAGWTEEGVLKPSAGCHQGFGMSVAIDGHIAFVGAPEEPNGMGKGRVCKFVATPSGDEWDWPVSGSALNPPVGAAYFSYMSSQYGRYIAYRDGVYAATRGPISHMNAPAAISELHIQYPDPNDEATFEDVLYPSSGSFVGGPGPVAVTGSIAAAQLGTMFGEIVVSRAPSWSSTELVGSGILALSSMALFGETIATCGPGVALWQKSGSTWQTQTIPNSHASSVAVGSLDPDASVPGYVVAGNPGDDDKGAEAGAVHVFEKDINNVWVEHAKLVDPNGGAGHELGWTVAASGNRIVAGAPGSGSTFPGKVVTFVLLGDLGDPCTSGDECHSAWCADGVCCNSGCTGTCLACNLSGSAGTCTNIPAGQDPADECAGSITCGGDGTCGALLANGASCAANAECQSGFCVENRCCDDACDGLCRACGNVETGAADGTCAGIKAGTDPDGECAGNAGKDVCNGSGACKEINGTQCAGASECLSNKCVDGVCCDSGCTGKCLACNLSGSAGTCTNIPEGQDPANECAGSITCGGNGACGALLAIGTACGSGGECQSGFCVDWMCCATACSGLCQACDVSGLAGQCTPVPAGMDPAQECAGDVTCNGAGACMKGQGQPCINGAECASGACADGVCCNEPCAGTCRACTLAKTGVAGGTCAEVEPGTDPDGECPGVADCNGTGACEMANGQACSAGSECQSGFCADGVCCNTSCLGDCRSCLGDRTGHPSGQCSAVLIGQDPDDDCGAGEVCDGGGACVRKNGKGCESADQCLSGHCYDGICCDTACTGPCETCNLAGNPGHCVEINAGSDPDSECPGETVCDGKGACTTLVAGQACTSGVECKSGFCADGVCCDGACGQPCKACSKAKTGWSDGMCAFVLPGADPDADCAGNAVCNGFGVCVAPAGEACATAAGCLSASCVDGVCCEDACKDACHACSAEKTGAASGQCAPVEAGADPDADCTPTGVCDGAGACKQELGDACAKDEECLGGVCADGVCCDRPCDGGCEACDLAGSEGLCAPHAAGKDPEGACVGKLACNGIGACGAGLELGQACVLDAECESGFCTDGVCCESACDGLCEACSLVRTFQNNGLCAAVREGSDPDAECPGSDACDGAFACKPAAGTPCSSAAQCLSGFCVDGVCCDTACGGGDLYDCQACSAMAGGPVDGTCQPVTAAAGIVCRPATSECDADETCAGDTIVCPADDPAEAGEACDDGDPLTQGDACDGGGECRGDTGCDDGNPCTQGDLWQADGSCAGAPAADGTACNDGDVCTEDDACESGLCTGEPVAACLPPETGWGGGGCMCSLPGGAPEGAGGAGLLAALAGLIGLGVRRRARRHGPERAPLS